MVDTYTTNKQIIKPPLGGYTGGWNVPVNNDWDIIDKALGGQYSFSSTGGTVALTTDQTQNQRIVVTGTLSSNLIITIPFQLTSSTVAVGGMWVFDNQITSSTYTVTVKTVATGSVGVVIDNAKHSLVYSDGVNCYFADDRASAGGTSSQPTGGGTNQVFFTNDQAVTADYTLPSNKNAVSAGPISVPATYTVTITPPSVWVIV